MTAFRVFVAMIAICFSAQAREAQTLNPTDDQELLVNLGMYQIGEPVPQRFNLMIIGQDDGAKKPRATLSSRADILMVLSIEIATGKMDILSLYRDNPVTSGCVEKLGRTPSYTEKINGVYSVGGRKQFIPCFEGMLEERLRANPELGHLLDANGGFEIHAFFEGTRTYTIKPVAKASLKVVMGNKFAFLTTYGGSALGAALDVLWAGEDIQKVLNAEGETDVENKDINSEYLSIELKERYAYRAGGYQRAFNFATVVAYALGWAAYGIEQHSGYEYDFMGYYFGDVINSNFSRSHDFKVLEKTVFMQNKDHVLRHACFKGGKTPIRIYQWVENSARTYAVYENGQISTNRKGSMLDHLKMVDILPAPPSCD